MHKSKKIFLKKATSIVLSLAFVSMLALPVVSFTTPASAQDLLEPKDWGIYYAAEVGLPQDDVRNVIVRIIKALLGFLGVAALIIILIGGVEWMTAGGNDDKVSTAQKRIGYGVIGLVIIFVAYALTIFIFEVIWNKAVEGG